MTVTLTITLVVTMVAAWVTIVLVIFWCGPRPRLDPSLPDTQVPPQLGPQEIEVWLQEQEKKVPHLIEGTEASIIWAEEAATTDLCLMYVHGFSASRQETAPLADRIAARLKANLVYLRLAGHGLSAGGMEAPAEAWLEDMRNGWELASRLGRRVMIIATSTGAPLSLWLAQALGRREQLLGLIFLSPNFKIRRRGASILTLPWANYWVPWVLGREQGDSLEEKAPEENFPEGKSPEGRSPEETLVNKYWTSRYPTQAVIEMQKVLDWVRHHCDKTADIPLATLYMEGDPTVDTESIQAFHQAWGAKTKRLYPVEIDAAVPQHVFVGDITAPQRLNWCLDVCTAFISSLTTTPPDPGPQE